MFVAFQNLGLRPWPNLYDRALSSQGGTSLYHHILK